MKSEIQPYFENKPLRRRGSALEKLGYQNYPDLEQVLKEIGPLPSEALFLGMANDGLPVLLNMHDAVPGPLLIVGDKGSGKTELLKAVAKGIPLTHTSYDTQYVVITNNVDEWDSVEDTPHMAAIVDIRDKAMSKLILSLSAWAYSNKNPGQATIFMLDDLTNVGQMDYDTRQNFRWLLLRGPSRKVWTIATGNSSVVDTLPDILDTFKTRLYGRVSSQNIESKLSASGARLNELVGKEFKLREGDKWIKFWIPS